MELCFASNNPNKLKEIRPLLEPDFRILSLADINCFDELEETQNTIEGNAIQKAHYVFQTFGVPCFADDTGLEVVALNNEPGVFSARYAGEQRNSDDNIDLLLRNLAKFSDRSAQFKTVIALAGFGKVKTFEGIVTGKILYSRRGDKGFGYDPVFQPDACDKTFAEMDTGQKNEISHRARAIHKFLNFLRNRGN